MCECVISEEEKAEAVTSDRVYKMHVMVDHQVGGSRGMEELNKYWSWGGLVLMRSRRVSLPAYQLYSLGISQTHTAFHAHICSTARCHQGEL